MEPQILDLPEIRVVGVPYFGPNNEGQFPATWHRFMGLSDLITNKSNPEVYYGVEVYTEDFQASGQWYYLAGVGVTSLDALPVQLVGKVIPANKYAVFTHRGSLPVKLGQTFQYAYKTWLPQSVYTQAAPYDLERYDDRFKGAGNEESVMEVCVPIKAR
jgi:AraC family transcriptional regulator